MSPPSAQVRKAGNGGNESEKEEGTRHSRESSSPIKGEWGLPGDQMVLPQAPTTH